MYTMKKTILWIIWLAILWIISRYGYTSFYWTSISATYSNISYATWSSRQVLDIYIPSTWESPYPVVVQIHGGAFKMWDKTKINSVKRLLDEWFAVIGMNYRFSSEATRPAQLEDLKSVIEFIKLNWKKYDIDNTRIASRGYSAWWYLSSMMGIALANEENTRIQAAINWFWPVDFYTMDEDIEASWITRKTGNNWDADSPESALLWFTIKENKDAADKASVLHYLSWAHDIPPFLIMHGAIDPMIWAKQSERLRNAITQKFGSWKVEYHLLANGGHGDGEFTTIQTEDIVIDFLKRNLQTK